MRFGRTQRCALAVVVAVSAGCGTSGSAQVDLRGAAVTVLASWSGVEQTHFEAVLAGFSRATGVRVTYVSAHGHVPEVLTARLAAGRRTDVALLPQPGLLRDYAARGRVVPLDAATRDAVQQHYGAVWQHLATVGGRLYGVWFKAADKSLVWYSVGAFEAAGVVPPDDLAGLLRVTRVLGARGIVPFGVAGSDAWTLTDWFENLYLSTAGPVRYSALTEHRLRWTDPTVSRALRLMLALLRPRFIAGGVAGALRTTFETSVANAFGPRQDAAMVAEGDFVASVIRTRTHAVIGQDVDVFPFPGSYQGVPVVVGGGDVAVDLRASAAARALMAYLASPGAAAIWAAAGGFLSPNQDLDLSVYPDQLSQAMARSVIEAGDGFRFDLSDQQPGSFGSAPRAGMQGALRTLLVTRDIPATERTLESGAQAAFGR